MRTQSLIPCNNFAGAVGTTLASLIVAMSQNQSKMDFTQATAKGSRNGFMTLFALGIFQLLLLFLGLSERK